MPAAATPHRSRLLTRRVSGEENHTSNSLPVDNHDAATATGTRLRKHRRERTRTTLPPISSGDTPPSPKTTRPRRVGDFPAVAPTTRPGGAGRRRARMRSAHDGPLPPSEPQEDAEDRGEATGAAPQQRQGQQQLSTNHQAQPSQRVPSSVLPPARAAGASALMYACQQGRDSHVRLMLEEKPERALSRDRTMKSALHYCAENATPASAELVLAAAPELLNARDEDGFTTLHLAVIAGNVALVRFLLQRRADFDMQDTEKHSVVHWATVCGEIGALEALLEVGANPSTADQHGGHPIHYAAQMCGVNSEMGNDPKVGAQVLKALLNRHVDVSVKDQDGRQPILWAASAGSADAVLALVNAGASVEADDKDGLTALHCAASRGHTECLETLVTLCGAEVNVIDSNGCTALFYAVTLGHADCTQLLLNYGAEPNIKDRKGRTAAHCGAAKGQLETLKLLAGAGADLWTQNVRGDLPLHEAVQSRRRELVRWLLALRPDSIVAANNDGRTCLHIAATNDNVEMCKVVIDAQSLVNPVMRGSKGQLMTPLDAALLKGNRGCAKYLQLHGGVPHSKLTEEAASIRGPQRAITDSQMAGIITPATLDLLTPRGADDLSLALSVTPSPRPSATLQVSPPSDQMTQTHEEMFIEHAPAEVNSGNHRDAAISPGIPTEEHATIIKSTKRTRHHKKSPSSLQVARTTVSSSDSEDASEAASKKGSADTVKRRPRSKRRTVSRAKRKSKDKSPNSQESASEHAEAGKSNERTEKRLSAERPKRKEKSDKSVTESNKVQTEIRNELESKDSGVSNREGNKSKSETSEETVVKDSSMSSNKIESSEKSHRESTSNGQIAESSGIITERRQKEQAAGSKIKSSSVERNDTRESKKVTATKQSTSAEREERRSAKLRNSSEEKKSESKEKKNDKNASTKISEEAIESKLREIESKEEKESSSNAQSGSRDQASEDSESTVDRNESSTRVISNKSHDIKSENKTRESKDSSFVNDRPGSEQKQRVKSAKSKERSGSREKAQTGGKETVKQVEYSESTDDINIKENRSRNRPTSAERVKSAKLKDSKSRDKIQTGSKDPVKQVEYSESTDETNIKENRSRNRPTSAERVKSAKSKERSGSKDKAQTGSKDPVKREEYSESTDETSIMENRFKNRPTSAERVKSAKSKDSKSRDKIRTGSKDPIKREEYLESTDEMNPKENQSRSRQTSAKRADSGKSRQRSKDKIVDKRDKKSDRGRGEENESESEKIESRHGAENRKSRKSSQSKKSRSHSPNRNTGRPLSKEKRRSASSSTSRRSARSGDSRRRTKGVERPSDVSEEEVSKLEQINNEKNMRESKVSKVEETKSKSSTESSAQQSTEILGQETEKSFNRVRSKEKESSNKEVINRNSYKTRHEIIESDASVASSDHVFEVLSKDISLFDSDEKKTEGVAKQSTKIKSSRNKDSERSSNSEAQNYTKHDSKNSFDGDESPILSIKKKSKSEEKKRQISIEESSARLGISSSDIGNDKELKNIRQGGSMPSVTKLREEESDSQSQTYSDDQQSGSLEDATETSIRREKLGLQRQKRSDKSVSKQRISSPESKISRGRISKSRNDFVEPERSEHVAGKKGRKRSKTSEGKGYLKPTIGSRSRSQEVRSSLNNVPQRSDSMESTERLSRVDGVKSNKKLSKLSNKNKKFSEDSKMSTEKQSSLEYTSESSTRSRAADSGVMMMDSGFALSHLDSPKLGHPRGRKLGVEPLSQEGGRRSRHGDLREHRMVARRPGELMEDERRARELIHQRHNESVVSVTQAVQVSTRKYQMERRIFQELLELKKLQIRAGRSNEHILVKRAVDEYRKAGLIVGLRQYDGPYNFRSFERYLYEQLRTLQQQSDECRLVARLKPTDDVDTLSAVLKRSMPGAPHHAAAFCTLSTHRCRHATEAYTSVPVAEYVSQRPSPLPAITRPEGSFLPRIDVVPSSASGSRSARTPSNRLDPTGDPLLAVQTPSAPRSAVSRSLQFVDPTRPVTLELSHGGERQVIALPTERLDRTKRYYVTFTIKPGDGQTAQNPSSQQVDDPDQTHHHAKSL